MKLYGSTKGSSTQTCRYGCCGGVLSVAMKHTKRGKAAVRAAKKTARRNGRAEVEARE